MKKTLVVGASGATGKLLVEQLLNSGQEVKVIVRPTGIIPYKWKNNDHISIIKASILEINVDEMAEYLSDCQSVASCLGHNLTIKGVFGKPRKLVSDAVAKLCAAIQKNSPDLPFRFVLMNTTAHRNSDEAVSVSQKLIMGLIRLFLPPQVDNEKAANFLREDIGQNHRIIEWVAVRPDTLIDEDFVSEYELYDSPTRSALFNPGKTSRINVANYMAMLIAGDGLWNKWQGKMPVIYNKGK